MRSALWVLPSLLLVVPPMGHGTDNAASICAASESLDGGNSWCRKILEEMRALRNPPREVYRDSVVHRSRESREKQRALFFDKIVPSAYASLSRAFPKASCWDWRDCAFRLPRI
jgi:hypothetical protein